jgi:hypothetical protein
MENSIEGRGAAAWAFLAHRLTKSHRVFGEVLQYWDGLRDGATLPARADLDPRVIQSALSNSFILDRTRPGTIRMRVAGGHMNALMGMEVRGMPIRAFFDLLERRRLMELVETVFTGPALLELDLISENQSGAPLTGKMLILPMRDHAGQVTKALGCLVTTGAIGATPRRFRIRREVLTAIEPAKAAQKFTPALSGFAERRAPFEPAPVADATPTFVHSRPSVKAIPKDLEDASEPGPVPWLRIIR